MNSTNERSTLTPAEIVVAVRILRAELSLPPGVRLVATRRPPSPRPTADRQPGDAIDRDAVVLVHDPTLGTICEATVAVDDGFVRSIRFGPAFHARRAA